MARHVTRPVRAVLAACGSRPLRHSRLSLAPSFAIRPLFNESQRLNLRLSTPAVAVESTLTGQGGAALATNGVCKFFDTQVGYNH